MVFVRAEELAWVEGDAAGYVLGYSVHFDTLEDHIVDAVSDFRGSVEESKCCWFCRVGQIRGSWPPKSRRWILWPPAQVQETLFQALT